MKLLLDIGNSQIKSATTSASHAMQVHGALPYDHDQLQQAFSQLSEQVQTYASVPVTEMWISNVAGDSLSQQIKTWAEQHYQITPHFITPQVQAYGISLSYTSPQQFGADRWLAMIAARQQTAQPACIVSCGTAITVDLLDASGHHIGGAIAPGFAIMQSALAHNTAACQLSELMEITDSAVDFTEVTNTRSAIRMGCLLMTTSYIDNLYRKACSQLGNEVQYYLCGGYAQALLPHLACDYLVKPNLVLQGLAVVAVQ